MKFIRKKENLHFLVFHIFAITSIHIYDSKISDDVKADTFHSSYLNTH